MNDIKILVIGTTASGKTTISQIIKKALENKEFKNIIILDDYDKFRVNKAIQNKRIGAIKDSTRILIETVQANKKGV